MKKKIGAMSDTKDEAAATTDGVNSTKDEEATVTNEEAAAAKDGVNSTKDEATATKDVAAATKDEDTATKDEATTAKDAATDARKQAQARAALLERVRITNEYTRARNARVLGRRHQYEQRLRTKKPEVRKSDLEHFKNRYNWTSEYEEYAVEAFVGPLDIHQHYLDEKNRRKSRIFTYNFPTQKETTHLALDLDSSNGYIHRIRVNSLPVLGYLIELMDIRSNKLSPMTFLRPFMSLVYFQPYMKKELANLEEKWAATEVAVNPSIVEARREDKTGQGIAMASEDNPKGQAGQQSLTQLKPNDGSSILNGDPQTIANKDQGDNDKTDGNADLDNEAESTYTASLPDYDFDEDIEFSKKIDQTLNSIEPLQDLRCYVKFVEEQIMPGYNYLRGDQAEKVMFDDLGFVFQPGDLVYEHNIKLREERLWRVYYVETPGHATRFNNLSTIQDNATRWNRTSEHFVLYCYRIDYDGSLYGAVSNKFEIPYFSGRKAIRGFDVWPVRFKKDCNEFIERLRLQGQKFHDSFSQPHYMYHNWTVPIEDDTSAALEFIEGHVIIDFEQTFQYRPDWTPDFFFMDPEDERPFNFETDEWPIRFHKNESNGTASVYFDQDESIQMDNHAIEMWQRRDNMQNDTFWKNLVRTSRGVTTVTGNDLVLLPRRSFAYTIRERKFISIDINHIRPVTIETGIFDRLKISREYKDIIRGLVSSHFQRKELEQLYTKESMEGLGQDLIQGKGKGLISTYRPHPPFFLDPQTETEPVLLHGAPGVGKTATAEAVAMENKRPLFTITCGDLGLTPSEVESSLNNTFYLASKWGCVLLLDEADVFLTQRSRLDLKRNALVSVFLRVLEYYNGLLFLTTNRVGTIDEAFKSRIHMSLYYPPLNEPQTTAIFRLNVSKLREMEKQKSLLTKQPELIIDEEDIINFAVRQFRKNAAAGACWNGRQIRNSFQVASSLASYTYQQKVIEARSKGEEPPAPPELNGRLFETVQNATNHFDHYIQEAKGWSDTDYAFKLGERADHIKPTRFSPTSEVSNQMASSSNRAPNDGFHQYTRSPSPGMAFHGRIPNQHSVSQYQSPDTPHHYAAQQHNNRATSQFSGMPPYTGMPTPTTPGGYESFQQTSQTASIHLQGALSQGYLSPTPSRPAPIGRATNLETQGKMVSNISFGGQFSDNEFGVRLAPGSGMSGQTLEEDLYT